METDFVSSPETAQTPPLLGTEEGNPASLLNTRLWQPNLIVFMSSACIMVLELVAGRILAPYVGVSLYTWTSIIGVVLAGISLGNYLGGKLADRRASLPFLGGAFLLAGVSCFGILAADPLGTWTPGHWPVIVDILVLTCLLFFLPCIILGTISPVVAKLAVRDLAETGSTVGKIYAAGALGSILGTFATGFVLISWFGTHTIAWGVAVVLMLMGGTFIFRRRWQPLLVFGLVLAVGSVIAFRQGWLNGPCTRETNYFCIKVREEVRDDETVRVLILDRLVHSYTSLDNPSKLVYGYEEMYAEAAAYRAERDPHLRALFIGGGGYTFPRYMEAIYPGSDIHVIEIDPGVTQVAYDMLGLAPDTDVVSYNQDARLFLDEPPGEPYDLILGDAFNDFSVPYHLTTREFNDRVRAWLADDGLYLVNMIDGGGGAFVRAYTQTLRQSFRYVYVAPTIHNWRGTPRNTFVLVASDAPLDLDALQAVDAGDGEPLLAQHMLSFEEVDAILREDRAVILTDRYAPVDQLLAPVVRGDIPE
jgi:spermidine synthase